jgi:hypothetical protein
VIPKPRFLFDSYKTTESQVTSSNESVAGYSNESSVGTEKKQEDDYFSFFSSHEKVILKPESNFKNLRQFMEFLPIDYYILLQEGYQKETRGSVKSNHIFYSNLPLLVKKRSYLKEKTDIVKNITYEDIVRCLDLHEAEAILNDSLAQDELIKHLTQKYGPIKEMFHINYAVKDIIKRFVKQRRSVGTDEVSEFEEALRRDIAQENYYFDESNPEFISKEKQMIEEASFQDLVCIAAQEGSFDEDAKSASGKKASLDKVLSEKTKAAQQVAEDLRKK